MTADLPAPATTKTAPLTGWRSTRGLRTALTWMLPFDIGAAIALSAAAQHQRDVLDRYHHGLTSFDAAQQADHVVGLVGLAYVALYVATGIVFINWMWRGAHNNERLGRMRPRYTPGWSIGGWFVPFLNFVVPVRVMHDLWQGSDPDAAGYVDWRRLHRSPLVGWWWGCYLAGGLFVLRYAGTALIAAAAVLAIILVRRITDRQEAARHASRGIAPGWYADPIGRFDHRYWSGSAWTSHVSRRGELEVDPLV